ncbi:MAG: AmpG family muropeptide MFS transporter [Rhodovibrionaceae bacterium]
MSEPAARRTWGEALAVYRDKRFVIIALMGFSSGLPLLLTITTLTYWLATLGVDKTSIGLFALAGLPYSLKFLWSPAVDHVRIPAVTSLLGQRRSWAILAQIGLIGSILYVGHTDPTVTPLLTAVGVLFIAFFSATQDIAIDAYRIEVLKEDEQGAGAASTQFGYRVGTLVAGGGALALSDYVAWSTIFEVMAALVLVGTATVLLSPEPAAKPQKTERTTEEWLRDIVVEPFRDFMQRHGWAVILLFALLYKYGDAIGGVMANPFYKDLGFSGVEIGSVTKVFGLIASLFGVFVGGVIVARYGIFKALIVGGALQASTNLLFAALAVVGQDISMLAVAIGADNFTGGLGTAAFVAYLSSLCNPAFTGTQYALLTSLMAFGRTAMSSGGGWLADQMDWASFFVATTLLAVPGMLLLFWLIRINRRSERRSGVTLEEEAP